MNELVIDNEGKAFELLEKIKKDNFPENTVVSFDGWPRFEITIKGEDFSSSIPTRVMKPILDLQKEIYRVYAEIKYNTSSTHKLTKEDRSIAELVVVIENGSSIFGIELDELFNKLIENMSGQQKLKAVATLGVLVACSYSWNSWLDHQAKIHEIDSRNEYSKEETKRLELVTNLVNTDPNLQNTAKSVDQFRNDLLRKLDDDDQIFIADKMITDGETAKRLTNTIREQSVPIQLNGNYRILMVDSSGGLKTGFKIKVRNDDNQEFMVLVPSESITDTQIKALQKGEWEKKSIYMEINAKKLRNLISSAILVSAKTL